jgi:hypothetical protein
MAGSAQHVDNSARPAARLPDVAGQPLDPQQRLNRNIGRFIEVVTALAKRVTLNLATVIEGNRYFRCLAASRTCRMRRVIVNGASTSSPKASRAAGRSKRACSCSAIQAV